MMMSPNKRLKFKRSPNRPNLSPSLNKDHKQPKLPELKISEISTASLVRNPEEARELREVATEVAAVASEEVAVVTEEVIEVATEVAKEEATEVAEERDLKARKAKEEEDTAVEEVDSEAVEVRDQLVRKVPLLNSEAEAVVEEVEVIPRTLLAEKAMKVFSTLSRRKEWISKERRINSKANPTRNGINTTEEMVLEEVEALQRVATERATGATSLMSSRLAMKLEKSLLPRRLNSKERALKPLLRKKMRRLRRKRL
jgi:hypothetical protein